MTTHQNNNSTLSKQKNLQKTFIPKSLSKYISSTIVFRLNKTNHIQFPSSHIFSGLKYTLEQIDETYKI